MINLINSEHWLIEKASQTPKQIAICSDTKEITFEQLANASISAAKCLSEQDIKPGENVGILADHDYRFWILVNAIWLIGAVPVPLNSRSTTEEIKWQLQKVEANTLIDVTDGKTNYALVHSITFNDFDFTNTEPIQIDFQHSTFSVQHSSLILFTSGSTGKSKAVLHTFKSLSESVKATDASFDLSNEDVWLASLPLYHIGGFMILVRSLITGSCVFFPKSLKHDDVIYSSYNHNPTHISFVSTTLKRILENGQEPNKNLKYVFLGGGPLSKEICDEALRAGFPIVKVYGSTETCSMVCALKPEEFADKSESVGKVLTEQIKIIESNGEILVSSPTLFKEYYKDEETTKQKIYNGFFHTGDFGKLDSESYLHIDSRREDIIITGGENVSAKEIETELNSLPNVTDSFVFGLKDEMWGQIVCAAVVPQNFSEDEIKSSLRNKLASYKIPKKFFFIGEIPRNEMGKVKRERLIQLLKLGES